jgi:hypothetical protein
MPILENFANTTELDAVNTILVSAGETPLPSSTILANQTAFDILTALDLLKKVSKEVQLEPWKFNTEDGVRHNPTATFNFLNPDGTQTLCNIFTNPSLIYTAWALTPCEENRDLDVMVRMSKQYTSGGLSVAVLFDKRNHRDGPEKDKYPAVYLDVLYALDFALMPEVARTYVAIVASRRFCQQTLGSAEKGTFSRENEVAALRLLKREQGRPRAYNFLNTLETLEIMGRPTVVYPYERKLYNK